jgi:hypothetical protein
MGFIQKCCATDRTQYQLKILEYKAIIFYTSRDTTKLAFLTLAVLKVGNWLFWFRVCWRWPNWVFWILLLAVLTLADLEGSLFSHLSNFFSKSYGNILII